MLNFKTLIALIFIPSISWAACDCGSVDSATPCTGQSISVTVTNKNTNKSVGLDSVYNWAFNSGGGNARCGQFANGDYWIAPASGQSSVTVTAITSNGSVSADVNPVPGNFGLGDGSRAYAGYNAAQNIISTLPQSYTTMTSIVAAVTRNELLYTACYANQAGECIDSYNIVSILTAVPEKAGSETIRPSINGTKELLTYDDFDWARVPASSFFPGTDATGLADIKRRWSHSIEIFSFYWSLNNGTTWTGPSSEGGRAYRSLNIMPEYGAGMGRQLTMDITTMMSDDHTIAVKKPVLAAILTYGSDLYHTFFEPVSGQKVRNGSGAGQHLGKIYAPALFAALAIDDKYHTAMRTIAAGDRLYWPQEMRQIHIGSNGPVWGDQEAPSIAWTATKQAYCWDGHPVEKTCDSSTNIKSEYDPHRYIDGPMAKPGAGYFELGYSGIANLGGLMLAIPRVRSAINFDAMITFVNRVRTHGLLTLPDPCVTPDTRESWATCNVYLGGPGCTYYYPTGTLGNTWGPTSLASAYPAGECVTTVTPGYTRAGRFASIDGSPKVPTSSYVANALWGQWDALYVAPPEPPSLPQKYRISSFLVKSIPNNN